MYVRTQFHGKIWLSNRFGKRGMDTQSLLHIQKNVN